MTNAIFKFACASCSLLVARCRPVSAEKIDPGTSVCQSNMGEGGSCQFRRSCRHAPAVRLRYWRLTLVCGEDRESAYRSRPEEFGPGRGYRPSDRGPPF